MGNWTVWYHKKGDWLVRFKNWKSVEGSRAITNCKIVILDCLESNIYRSIKKEGPNAKMFSWGHHNLVIASTTGEPNGSNMQPAWIARHAMKSHLVNWCVKLQLRRRGSPRIWKAPTVRKFKDTSKFSWNQPFSAVIIIYIYIYLQNPENSYSFSWAFNRAAGPTCRQILQYWLTNVIFISFRLVYYLPCLASCKATIRSHAIWYMTNFLLLTRIYRSLETGSRLSLQFMIAFWTSLIYCVKLWLIIWSYLQKRRTYAFTGFQMRLGK